MLADYFTKSLQGRMLRLFRNILIGYTPVQALLDLIPIKERVEIEKMRTKTEKLLRINPSESKEKILHHLLKRMKNTHRKATKKHSQISIRRIQIVQ